MQTPVPQTVRLKGLLLTALGIPVMSALVTGAIVQVVRSWGTSLPDRAFWLGIGIFGGVSFIALGVVLRANWRVRRTGETGLNAMLARWSPLLMVIGGVGGVIIGGRIVDSALQSRLEFHTRECAKVVDQNAVPACIPVMERCDMETRDGPGLAVDRAGRLAVDWPAGLDMPSGDRTRARVLCAWRALKDRP